MLDLLASGSTSEKIKHDYGVTPEDVQACIAYGSEVACGRCVPVPLDSEA